MLGVYMPNSISGADLKFQEKGCYIRNEGADNG